MELMNNYERSLKGVSGVYKIRNLTNNKFYIGSTNNLYKRLYSTRHFQKKERIIPSTCREHLINMALLSL